MKSSSYYFKVRNLIGDLEDPKFVSGALSNTASEIINILNPEYYYLVAQEILTGVTDAINNVGIATDLNDNNKKGFTLENDKILSVSVKGLGINGTDTMYRRAKRVDSKWIDFIRNGDSMLAPNSQEPVFVRKGKSIWIYGIDTPADTNDFLKIQYVGYPSLSYLDEYGTGVFPEELEPALIMGAAARVRLKELSEIDDKITSTVSTTIGGNGLTGASTQLENEDLDYAKAYLEMQNTRIQQMIAEGQTLSAESARYAQKYSQLIGEIDRLSQNFYSNLLPYLDSKVQSKIQNPGQPDG